MQNISLSLVRRLFVIIVLLRDTEDTEKRRMEKERGT